MTHMLGIVFLVISFPIFAISVVPFAIKKDMKRSLILLLVGVSALGNGLVMINNPHLFDAAQTSN